MEKAYCFGFGARRRHYLSLFLGGRPIVEVRSLAAWLRKPSEAPLYVWGSQMPQWLPDEASARIVRVEDGFLRSVGLGAAFSAPFSWTFDDLGLHHWGHRPSRLERILASYDFDANEVSRGHDLIATLRAHNLSKYNIRTGALRWRLAAAARHRQRVLVVGQVSDDAAIQGIRTPIASNVALLRNVRQLRPDAWIVYKPHPDVLAGLRIGLYAKAQDYADQVIDEACALPDVLADFDEVHVMNSLSGFEALIWGKPVVCHAQPFYAGWGLTEDLYPVLRRTRQLSLPQLVWAALALYPRYIDPRSGKPLDVWGAIDALLELRRSPPRLLDRAGWMAGRALYLFRKVAR